MKKSFITSSTPIYIGSIILAVYASDLHKLVLSIYSFFVGNIGFVSNYGRLLDTILVVLCAFNASLAVLLRPKIAILFNIPVLTQILIVLLLSLSLMKTFDPISLENYSRFIAGNILIFFSAIVICKTPVEIQRVWIIWIITTVCLSIISIIFFYYGINWSTGRSEIIPIGNIRTGYFGAVSVCYIFTNITGRLNLKQLLYLATMMLLILGIVTCGSKASLLLTMFGIGLIITIPILTKFKVPKKIVYVLPLILLLCVFAGYISNSQDAGFIKDTLNVQSYFDAGEVRLESIKSYMMLGASSLIFGNGINAAYSLDIRTHSVFTAFFVQIGILGIIAYFVFLINLLFKGVQLIVRQQQMSKKINQLVISTFIAFILLVIKAEITSDIPGNRELWLFSGMILAIFYSDHYYREISKDKY